MDPNATDTTGGGGPLDLEQADLAGTAGESLICAHCGAPIGDEYYTLGEAVHCPRCQDGARELLAKGPGLVGCVRAFGFGGVAATVGAGIWAAVTQLTGYEIGIIAIAVGWLVGVAVRAGSRGIGGVPYQVLAIAFTYLAVVATYVPLILDTWAATPIEELMGEEMEAAPTSVPVEGMSDTMGETVLAEAEPLVEVEVITTDAELVDEAGVVVDGSGELVIDAGVIAAAFVLALALPFMMGFENAIGILIIGIALWEAWRQTGRAQIEIGGPFRVGSPGPG